MSWPCPVGSEDWQFPEVIDEDGVPGQDEANPTSAFNAHFIVEYNSKYYDPSYGAGPFDTELEWETHSIFGYAGFALVNPPSLFFLGVRLDDPTISETEFRPLQQQPQQ